MNGLRSILVTNNISALTNTTPVNAAAYGSTDLIRDTLQACAVQAAASPISWSSRRTS